MKWIDRNSFIYLAIIGFSVAMAVVWHPALILFWPLALLVDDALHYTKGLTIFDPEERIQRGYQFGHVFVDGISGEGRDLGFNLYDGETDRTRTSSQREKWDFMLEQLQLKPGDRLIDIGCGYGDWLDYARSKGLDVVGVNITREQAEAARERFGLDIIETNWKDIPNDPDLRKRLYGAFDAVTFMDTIEHYIAARDRLNNEKKKEVYTAMFEMAHHLLKDDSKRVFISCLHQTESNSTWKSFLYSYLLDHYHSGCYPWKDDGLTKYATKYFRELARYDKTEDYRLTSVKDRKHFGAPKIQWTARKIVTIPLLFFLDPHHVFKWIDIKVDAWMKWHFGEHAWAEAYERPEDGHPGYARLWWLVLEKAPAA